MKTHTNLLTWVDWTDNPREPICYRENNDEPDCDVCKENIPISAQPPIAGNPIIISSSIKQEIREDYSNTKGTLRLVWTYRSDRNTWQHNYQLSVLDLKSKESSDQSRPETCYTDSREYCYRYAAISATNDIAILRGAQRVRLFSSNNQFLSSNEVKYQLRPLVSSDGKNEGWVVINGDTDAEEIYDASGRIIGSTKPNGQKTSFIYSDETTPSSIAPKPGLLIAVTDNFDDSLRFSYDTQSRLIGFTDPSGEKYSYTYVGSNISSVIYPGGGTINYFYKEPSNIYGVYYPALTGIIDENGSRYATFKYSGLNATSTENAGSVNKFTVDNQGNYAYVKDPLGVTRTYYFSSILGIKRLTGVLQPNPSGNGSVRSTISYDANGNVSSAVDFAGWKTNYAYDLNRNLEISRTEAAGTSNSRIITTEWHPIWQLKTRISQPLLLITNTYDEYANLVIQSIQSTTDLDGSRGLAASLSGSEQKWRYTYNTSGQITSFRGPRTDVDDTTKYTYDEKGNLSSVANAVGHTTMLSNYDANGHVGRITDPNGLLIELTYTSRGWLASRTVGSENTSFAYDNVGQLIGVNFPDGYRLAYFYDPAHRLIRVEDGNGNIINYALDAMANRTQELVTDSTGVLARKVTRVFDTLNLLKKQTGAKQ